MTCDPTDPAALFDDGWPLDRRLFWALVDLLTRDGKSERAAHRVAMRCTRVALLVTDNYQNVAHRLGVSDRQIRRDLELVRRVLSAGLGDMADRDLPALPWDEALLREQELIARLLEAA